jgi:hypothetical protein
VRLRAAIGGNIAAIEERLPGGSTRVCKITNAKMTDHNDCNGSPNKKRKVGGRPRDELADKIVEPCTNERTGAKQHRCRFCHHTFAQRNCGRVKDHAASACLVIPQSLKTEVQNELAQAAPSEKAKDVGVQVFGEQGVPSRHCATCTCGMMEHTPAVPMVEGQRKLQFLLEYTASSSATLLLAQLGAHPGTSTP